MTICKNTSDPNRDDEYGKDGYTACCPKESCQSKIGSSEFFNEKIGKPSKEEDIVQKYQFLACYQCGKKNEG